MRYSVVLRKIRKRTSYEVLRDLGECASVEDAVEAAQIWLRLAQQQILTGWSAEIERAFKKLEPPLCISEILPNDEIFVRDEDGTLYQLQ